MSNNIGLGITYRFSQGATFRIIGIDIHYHQSVDEGCQAYRGIIFAFAGLEVFIGLINYNVRY